MAKNVVGYSSSESESEDEIHSFTASKLVNAVHNLPVKAKKRSEDAAEAAVPTKSAKIQKKDEIKHRLPVPSGIRSMFASKEEVPQDPCDHDGRIRTFGHERGNWASHLFIAADAADQLRQLASALIESLPCGFRCVDDLHVSLSRTFVVRHHWIKDLRASLGRQLASCPRCTFGFRGIDFLVNDEGTRTFMVLKTCSGFNTLSEYVSCIDAALDEYKLPRYYEEPSFHVSLAWALGDVKNDIDEAVYSDLQESCADFLAENPNCALLDAKCVVFRTGNRQYDISLR